MLEGVGEGSGQEGTSGVGHSYVVVGFRLGGHGRCRATCAWWLEDFNQADVEEWTWAPSCGSQKSSKMDSISSLGDSFYLLYWCCFRPHFKIFGLLRR
jgi:hypothetical protein